MLSAIDKVILNSIQEDLPLTDRPYAQIAERLGLEEQDVIERLRRMKEHGFIRKIGAFFDSDRLGYTGTLVAVKVEPAQLDAVAIHINAFRGVTHNYQRDGEYNLWFTLIVAGREEQEQILAQVAAFPGVLRVVNLPAVRKYKVNVQFALE